MAGDRTRVPEEQSAPSNKFYRVLKMRQAADSLEIFAIPAKAGTEAGRFPPAYPPLRAIQEMMDSAPVLTNVA